MASFYLFLVVFKLFVESAVSDLCDEIQIVCNDSKKATLKYEARK